MANTATSNGPIPPNRLHDVMRDEGRNFSWLSKTSGFSHYHISRVANGHERPSKHFRQRIAAVLGIPESRIWPRARKEAA